MYTRMYNQVTKDFQEAGGDPSKVFRELEEGAAVQALEAYEACLDVTSVKKNGANATTADMKTCKEKAKKVFVNFGFPPRKFEEAIVRALTFVMLDKFTWCVDETLEKHNGEKSTDSVFDNAIASCKKKGKELYLATFGAGEAKSFGVIYMKMVQRAVADGKEVCQDTIGMTWEMCDKVLMSM
jgi:hypothetical protein